MILSVIIIFMALEDEMMHEIKRLEDEILLLEKELKHITERTEQLTRLQQKKKRDLDILKSHFNMINGNGEKKEIQTTLARL